MNLVRITAATASCIKPEIVLANQRVKSTTETELIKLWIKAAEDLVEARTNRSIMEQTFVLSVANVLPTVTLFRPGMDGVVKIESAGTTVGSSLEQHDVTTLVGSVSNMLPTVGFPTILEAKAGSAQIEYTTGASDPDMVPASIRQAVLLLSSHWYRNREAVVTDQRRGTGVELPYGAESLIRAWRIPNVNVAPNEA